ncbi:hypothetical protein EDD22DRAFT_851320 [Suillus occidentalis]|nr:hypothetical protein EDD22DRAFT_851320 [Suillus occidentalis]
MDTVGAGAELSEPSNCPPHSTALDNCCDMTEIRHHNLTECHSHWQESEGSTYAPDEAAVDRFPALPHLNHTPDSTMHSPGTTFVIVNGMTLLLSQVPNLNMMAMPQPWYLTWTQSHWQLTIGQTKTLSSLKYFIWDLANMLTFKRILGSIQKCRKNTNFHAIMMVPFHFIMVLSFLAPGPWH